jgi:hypothetical protein
MKLTIAQKRIFRDQVVNASTGRPVKYTEQEQKLVDAQEASEKADEQEFIDWFGDSDNAVPSQDIYPDGESVKAAGFPLPRPISDRHVGADGRITRETGRVFGVFRAGAFGKSEVTVSPFDKFGDSFGFGDRPLEIRDVSYPEPEGLGGAALNGTNGTGCLNGTDCPPAELTPLCSGHPCKDYGVGGDDVYDLAGGQRLHKDVGPDSTVSDWDLDRQIDARTGDERPGCLKGAGGCAGDDGWSLGDLVTDEWGTPPGGVGGDGVGAVGAAVPASDPRAPPAREHTIWDPDGRGHADMREVPPPYYTTYPKGDAIEPPPPPAGPAGGWTKRWDTGSWLAFGLIGPVLTTGITAFIYFTRGPALALLVVGLLALLDVVIFYFG